MRGSPRRNADPVVGEPVDGKVFPERALCQIITAELGRPVVIRGELVDQHGPVFPAVAV